MRSFCLATFLSALIIVPLQVAQADTSSPYWPGLQCQWHYPNSVDALPHITELQAYSKAAAVKACYVRQTQERAYFTAGTPRKSASGVCWYRLEQAFRDEQEKAGWSWTPPENYKFPPAQELYFRVSEGECPHANIAAYIAAHDMSEGVFLAFWEFWKEASASPDALEKLTDEKIKQSTAFTRLKEVIGDSRFKIDGISSNQRGNSIVYSFGINDFRYARTGWLIWFDLTPSGIKILEMTYGSE
jgi:hypothetical protein